MQGAIYSKLSQSPRDYNQPQFFGPDRKEVSTRSFKGTPQSARSQDPRTCLHQSVTGDGMMVGLLTEFTLEDWRQYSDEEYSVMSKLCRMISDGNLRECHKYVYIVCVCVCVCMCVVCVCVCLRASMNVGINAC